MPLRTPSTSGRVDVTYRNDVGETYRAQVLGTGVQLTTPGAPTVTPQGTPGTTTYRYRVSAVDADGVESLASSGGQTTTGAATLNGTNFNRVTWAAVAGAVSYRVYGRTGADGTLQRLATVTGVTTYDDTGTATPSGALPNAVAATTRKLLVWLGGTDVTKNAVPKATSTSSTNSYFAR